MRIDTAVRLAFLAALARVFGGAALLWWLGAPEWAWVAWLIANVRIGIGRPRGGDGPPDRAWKRR